MHSISRKQAKESIFSNAKKSVCQYRRWVPSHFGKIPVPEAAKIVTTAIEAYALGPGKHNY